MSRNKTDRLFAKLGVTAYLNRNISESVFTQEIPSERQDLEQNFLSAIVSWKSVEDCWVPNPIEYFQTHSNASPAKVVIEATLQATNRSR